MTKFLNNVLLVYQAVQSLSVNVSGYVLVEEKGTCEVSCPKGYHANQVSFYN